MGFKENSYCYIWLEDNPDRAKNQADFRRYMRKLRIPEPITEPSLIATLADLSNKIGHKICYHLSSTSITDETRIYFQSELCPKKEEVISRDFTE